MILFARGTISPYYQLGNLYLETENYPEAISITTQEINQMTNCNFAVACHFLFWERGKAELIDGMLPEAEADFEVVRNLTGDEGGVFSIS